MNAVKKISEFERFGSVLGLERITMLLEMLGNPQDDLKVIHVAGTNGKGSICRYIYSVLKESGYKVGLYTSPFLEIFNERIEFDGEYISDSDLGEYTDKVLTCVKKITEAGNESPTEFEVITAIAFLYFKEKGADYVVLEVGLGGRGDSTNVIKNPLVSIIASISFDHTDRLGTTLTEIAGEKAGIIKDNCPVVTSARASEALAVIKKVSDEHNSPYIETNDIPYSIVSESLGGYVFDAKIPKNVKKCQQDISFKNIEISMLGEHQIENAICSLTAINVLIERGVEIPVSAIYEGMKTAKQIGRFEIMTDSMGDSVSDRPTFVIDGAHNPDGALMLKNAMGKFFHSKKVLMVTGMLKDKDVDGALSEFMDITKDFIATEPDSIRKMSASELGKKLQKLGANVNCIEDIKKATDFAIKKAQHEGYEVLLFSGSLYLIGEVRKLLKAK